jgi:hypothetical protein
VLLALVPQWGPAPFVYGALLGSSAGALKIAGTLVWPAYYRPAHVGSIKEGSYLKCVFASVEA